MLDMSESDQLDYYLVLTGPPSGAASSRRATRPWCIEAVFLFDARKLRAKQIERGVKRGIASSVLKSQWTAAEIYPAAGNSLLTITSSHRHAQALAHVICLVLAVVPRHTIGCKACLRFLAGSAIQ